MKRYSIVLLLIVLLLAGCKKDSYSKNDNAKLNGTISYETTDDNETKAYLNLDEPIIIDDKSVNKIEIDYDKELKDNTKTGIEGTIKEDNGKYLIEVDDIDNLLSYVNKYSNDVFSLTIPTDIIKIVTVEKTDTGFIIYSTRNMDKGGKVLEIKYITTTEYKKLNNKKQVINRITSNDNYTIISISPTTTEYNAEYAKDYEIISDHIKAIEKSIKLK